MKVEIKTAFAEIKLRKRNKIRTQILREDPNRKKFWRFIKSQAKAAGSISGIYDMNGEMVFDQDQIEQSILGHFSSIFKAQSIPVYTSNLSCNSVSSAIDDIDRILSNTVRHEEDAFEAEVCSLYTMTELGTVLDKLPNEKASGVDGIPNELLKHSGE